MIKFVKDNTVELEQGKPLTINNTQLPANWLNLATDKELLGFGIVKVYTVDAAPPPPIPADILVAAKANKLVEMNSMAESMIIEGVVSLALGDLHVYPSTLVDQQNLMANIISSLLPGLPTTWTTMQLCKDAAEVWAYRAHTALQIQQVGIDTKTAISKILIDKANILPLIDNAATVDEVTAITFPR